MESSEIELPPNPCKKANLLSKCFFSWVVPFFKKPYERDLDIYDLYKTLEGDRAEILGQRLEK